MRVSWDARSYAVDVVLPDSGARYYRPGNPLRISTEAFYVHPGLLRAFYWDLKIQREHSSTWQSLRQWKLIATDAQPDGNTWGMKRATFQGRPAIEVSNDGTCTYLKKGEILELE
jgi:hypothetical protein